MTDTPNNILLIKAHSMGIGDLLRSTAAWRAIKQRWPASNLHLLMLKKQDSPATEVFIRSHYLLSSATFVIAKSTLANRKQRSVPFALLLRGCTHQLADTNLDLVIDCEPYGIKTSLLARQIARQRGIKSVGIAQFPLRRYFYDLVSPSTTNYIKKNSLPVPMDYTERDFVVLDCLGIDRQQTRIELKLNDQALQWQTKHAGAFDSGGKQVVLNIGCGTPDALPKRPQMHALLNAMVALYQRQAFALHLSGADYEKNINDQFMALLTERLKDIDRLPRLINWAGQCTLNQSAGLIAKADIMISSDSGPYHMAVALRVPTLCWFNFSTPASHHTHRDVALLVKPSPEEFADTAMRLLRGLG